MVGELGERDLETFSEQSVPPSRTLELTSILILQRERNEFTVYLALLKLVPTLEGRLMSSDEEEDVVAIAELVSPI
jgi:hypothetical protein